MRIEFLTQDDPLYILPFFEEFLGSYSSEFEILQISCSPTMGKRSRVQMLRELTALYGVVGIAKLLGTTGVSRTLGRLPRDRSARRFHGIEQIAKAYEIKCQKIRNPNAPDFVDSVRKRAPDVLVSVACPYILKQALLSIPSLGCVNIHHAPLPRYKGMMPTFWQMYHRENSVGVTVHLMAAKIDEGAALIQEVMETPAGATLHDLIRRSKRHGAHCMARALRLLSSTSYSLKPLDTEKGTYFTFPTVGEIREFHRRGYRAI
jgi:methionyl-tRNA formyltransferase